MAARVIRKFVGWLGRRIVGALRPLGRPSDSGSVRGWTPSAIIGKLPYAENPHLEEFTKQRLGQMRWGPLHVEAGIEKARERT
jgi:hypothetical protein